MSQISLLAPLAGTAPVPTGFSDEWYTPRWWLDPLFEIVAFRLRAAVDDALGLKIRFMDKPVGISLDVCASKESAKCDRYYDIYADGLTQPWDAPWWCNPPYSNITPWVEKAMTSVWPGFMLLPAWTDRGWWQEKIEPYRDDPHAIVETAFHRRIQFGYPGNPECDKAILREHQRAWKEAGEKDAVQGSKIYPVLVAFIPEAFRRGLSGVASEHWRRVRALTTVEGEVLHREER